MTSRRHDIATLAVDGHDLRLRYADLLVVDRPESDTADWESIVVPLDDPGFGHGAYELEFVTLDGRTLRGPALLVRDVEGTIVFRGAGPLTDVG